MQKGLIVPPVILLLDIYPGTESAGGWHLQKDGEWQGRHLSTGAHD